MRLMWVSSNASGKALASLVEISVSHSGELESSDFIYYRAIIKSSKFSAWFGVLFTGRIAKGKWMCWREKVVSRWGRQRKGAGVGGGGGGKAEGEEVRWLRGGQESVKSSRALQQPVGLEHLCAVSNPISHWILLTESFKTLEAAIYKAGCTVYCEYSGCWGEKNPIYVFKNKVWEETYTSFGNCGYINK